MTQSNQAILITIAEVLCSSSGVGAAETPTGDLADPTCRPTGSGLCLLFLPSIPIHNVTLVYVNTPLRYNMCSVADAQKGSSPVTGGQGR